MTTNHCFLEGCHNECLNGSNGWIKVVSIPFTNFNGQPDFAHFTLWFCSPACQAKARPAQGRDFLTEIWQLHLVWLNQYVEQEEIPAIATNRQEFRTYQEFCRRISRPSDEKGSESQPYTIMMQRGRQTLLTILKINTGSLTDQSFFIDLVTSPTEAIAYLQANLVNR